MDVFTKKKILSYLLKYNFKSLRSNVWSLNYEFFTIFLEITSRKHFIKIFGSSTQDIRVCMKFFKIGFLPNVNDNVIILFGFEHFSKSLGNDASFMFKTI